MTKPPYLYVVIEDVNSFPSILRVPVIILQDPCRGFKRTLKGIPQMDARARVPAPSNDVLPLPFGGVFTSTVIEEMIISVLVLRGG
jgi:hypothetical protein